MTDEHARPTHSDLVLRDVVDADLPVFFEHQRDPEANRMAAFPPRERTAFMVHWARILAEPSIKTKTIVVGGRVAGNIVSFERFGKREVGYWIGREHWGRGIATRALAAFLLEDLARPLYARVARHNVGSIRVLEKCGFAPSDDEDDTAGAPDDGVEDVLLKLGAEAR